MKYISVTLQLPLHIMGIVSDSVLCVFSYNLPFGMLVLNSVRTDWIMHESVAKQLKNVDIYEFVRYKTVGRYVPTAVSPGSERENTKTE